MKINLRIPLLMMLIAGFSMIGSDRLMAQQSKLDSLEGVVARYVPNDNKKASDLFLLAAGYIYSNPKKSLVFADQILSFEKNITGVGIVSSSYRLKGLILTMLARFTEALSAFNTALVRDRNTGNAYGEAGDLSGIANIHLYQSNLPQALNFYQQSTRILKNIPESDPKNYNDRKRDEAAIYGNIGLVYLETKEYAKAIEHFEKSIAAHQKLKNNLGIIPALSNIGNIYNKQHDYKKAIIYADSATKMAQVLGDRISYARETGNLSGYYSNTGRYDRALSYGLKAIALNKELGNTKSIGFNMQNVSEAYLKKNDLAQAKRYALGALKIGKDLKMPEIQRDASDGLSKVYEKLAMPDSALFYYKSFAMLKDSISNSRKRDEIARLSIQYEFDKKETDYQQQQVLNEEQLKQQRLQLALNAEQLNASIRLRSLQQAQLQNEKLQKEEKQKLLLIAENNGKLQSVKVKQLSQLQMLNKLELKQLWLYAIIVVIILISILLLVYNKYRIRQIRLRGTLQQQQSEQLNRELSYQNQLSESELKAIRSQMNPHFIFNVLNSIESYIMDNDRKVASRLIQKFAALSRLILENSTKSLVTADREWKAIRLYTELEAIRYDQIFSHEFILDESIELRELLLPPMLIQPLIENAILHGLIVAPKKDAHLSVSLKKEQTGICVTIVDNGVGLSFRQKPKSIFLKGIKEQSMGLESIKERIEMINRQHPSNVASFSIEEGAGGIGTVAVICLPVITESESSQNINQD
ncbi:Tetratricopeptide TPR_2 [Pedobacter sp. BAL39]|uniref:tetratricopeptide repeat-containing sensor histidine kinase n=1 Tax=Pedobacter sp. BAL39 TaxID=391596 RepID=UPI0001559531|nr:tetratricopeptide repeat protein [Pedobacter sp. BAL39]EDM36170.1 Tetratricopeptide TPR_2 [Pedobacter sp. BAL39]